jgi:hypothetical protein
MPAPPPAQPPARPARLPGADADDPAPGDDEPLTSAELAELDRDLDPADYDQEDLDPDTSPPGGPDAWRAAAARPLRAAWPAGGPGLAEMPGVPEVLAAGFAHGDAGRGGPGFGAGGAADQLLPGRVLAGLAGDAWRDGLERLGDDELVGVMLAARRCASWQAALELAAVTELAARRDGFAEGSGDQRGREHLSQEIAAACTLTGRGADALLALATGLGRLPQAGALLAAGVIDRARAVVIADELACLDSATAAAVAALVLPRAGELTTGQLRAALRRAALAADPAAAIRRREKAQHDARVEAWTETAGTAALAGRDLPPAAVIAADRHIDAAARWLKDHGAHGTLTMLRAAVFLALLAGQSPSTLLPPAPPAPGSGNGNAGPASTPAAGNDSGSGGPGGWPWPGGTSLWGGPGGPSGSVHLTMPLTAWAGQSDAPGEAAGLGPQDAGTCRELAAALAARSSTRWCLTLTDHQGRAVAHACARAGPGPPATSPAAWLASLSIKTLESGTCSHQRQATAYRPPAALRHLIKIRDRTCAFPGCRRRAIRCDDDHTIPYHLGGRTCECNLSPLCRQHHRAKQAPGWHLDQPQPGTLTWTLPHGRSYTITPGTYPA